MWTPGLRAGGGPDEFRRGRRDAHLVDVIVRSLAGRGGIETTIVTVACVLLLPFVGASVASAQRAVEGCYRFDRGVYPWSVYHPPQPPARGTSATLMLTRERAVAEFRRGTAPIFAVRPLGVPDSALTDRLSASYWHWVSRDSIRVVVGSFPDAIWDIVLAVRPDTLTGWYHAASYVGRPRHDSVAVRGYRQPCPR